MSAVSEGVIRVVVVEDEPASRAHIRRLAGTFPGVEVVAECGDGTEAVRAIVEHRPDLVFLDVQLPELDGFQVLAALGPDHPPAIIFVTAHENFAVRAFETQAVDYLLKPFGPARFAKAFGHALERLRARTRGDVTTAPTWRDSTDGGDDEDPNAPLARFVARVGRKVYFIPMDAVDWIDVADNYLRLHCAGRTHLVRGSLGAIAGRLPSGWFVRVHRGLLVRVDRITSIRTAAPGQYSLTMADGARLVTSRSYTAEVRALFR